MICNFTFYALGLVELHMLSQKFRYLKILIITPQTPLCVKVLPVFVANSRLLVVVLSRAWRCEFDLWSLVLVWFGAFFDHDIFLQHFLGLVRYTEWRFHTFTSPKACRFTVKWRLFKTKPTQKIRPDIIVLQKKKKLYWGVHRHL